MGRAGALLLAMALAVAGCGGDDDDSGDAAGAATRSGDAEFTTSSTADLSEATDDGVDDDDGADGAAAVGDGLFTGGEDGAIEVEVRDGAVVRFSAPIVVPCGASGFKPDVVVVEEPIAIDGGGSFAYDSGNVKVSGRFLGDRAEGVMSLSRGDTINTPGGIAFCNAFDVPWAVSR